MAYTTSGSTTSITFDHAHTVNSHSHTISKDGGTEARPDNFTQIIWKRIS